MEHATVAPPWAQAAEHAIAAGQWHGAWCALLDAALPAPLARSAGALTLLKNELLALATRSLQNGFSP